MAFSKSLALAAVAMAVGSDAQCLGGNPTNPLPAGRHSITIDWAGGRRTFEAVVPRNYNRERPTPLVLSFHGFSNTNTQQCTQSGTYELSEELGFLAICPTGSSFPSSWNGGECCGPTNRDDVGYARAMVDALSDRVCIDEASVYSIGYSNGGYMSYRLACEASDMVAGILNTAGLLSSPSAFPCNPEFQVPVYHVHGTADAVINYVVAAIGYERYAEDVHGCSVAQTETYSRGAVTCVRKNSCPGGMAAEFCSIERGSHTNIRNNDIDPLRRAWDFWGRNKKTRNPNYDPNFKFDYNATIDYDLNLN